MKKTSLTVHFDVFEKIADLPEPEQELLISAKNCLEKAYAPYSKFHVGAAIRLDNDKIVCGTNIENASYPLCLCAEPSALAAAKSLFPENRAVSMAISVKNCAAGAHPIEVPAMPCGACRQILSEAEDRFGHPIRLILMGETGEIWAFQSAKNILPFAFSGDFLTK